MLWPSPAGIKPTCDCCCEKAAALLKKLLLQKKGKVLDINMQHMLECQEIWTGTKLQTCCKIQHPGFNFEETGSSVVSTDYRTTRAPSLQLKKRKLVGIRSPLSAYNCNQLSPGKSVLQALVIFDRKFQSKSRPVVMGCPFACKVPTGHDWLQHSILFLGKLCSVTVSVYAANVMLCNAHSCC